MRPHREGTAPKRKTRRRWLARASNVEAVGLVHEIRTPLPVAAQLLDQLQSGLPQGPHGIAITVRVKATDQVADLDEFDREPTVVGIQVLGMAGETRGVLQNLGNDSLVALNLANMVIEGQLERS